MKTKKVILKTLLFFMVVASIALRNVPASAENVGVSATLNPSASITLPASTTPISVSPTGAGVFNHTDLEVTAYTNSVNGFTVTMTPTNTALTRTTMNDDDEYPTIPTLDNSQSGYVCLTYAEQAEILNGNNQATIPECTFGSNKWGVAVDDGNYFAASSGMTLKATSEASGANGSSMTVKLGAKVDMLVEPGSYETTLNFAITANVSE